MFLSAVSLTASFFFFNDTATTEIYTLSLHDALPISALWLLPGPHRGCVLDGGDRRGDRPLALRESRGGAGGRPRLPHPVDQRLPRVPGLRRVPAGVQSDRPDGSADRPRGREHRAGAERAGRGRRAGRHRRGGRARRWDVRDGGGADRSQPLRPRATRAAPDRRSSSPPHDDESRRLPSETRGHEAHLGPFLVPLVRRYSMNPIRHCAFAVVLSLAVNRLPAQHPPAPAPAPAPGDRVRVTSADRRTTGTLESIDGDTIVVRRSNGALTKFARAPRPRLDVSTGAGMCGEGRRATCVIGGVFGGALVGLGEGGVLGGGCDGGEVCGIQYGFPIPPGALVGIIVGSD